MFHFPSRTDLRLSSFDFWWIGKADRLKPILLKLVACSLYQAREKRTIRETEMHPNRKSPTLKD